MIGLGESVVFSCNEGELTVKAADGQLTTQLCDDPFQFIRDFGLSLKYLMRSCYPDYPVLQEGWSVILAMMQCAILNQAQ